MSDAGKTWPKEPLGLFKWFSVFAIGFALANILLFGVPLVTWAVTGVNLGVEPEPFAPDDPWNLAVLGFELIALAFLVVLVSYWVILARLNFRLVKNLKHWQENEMLMGPGWPTIWYFIPFANFVMPFKGVKQIWRATFEDARLVSGAPEIITTWWGFYMVGAISGFVIERLFRNDGGAPYHIGGSIAALIFSLAIIQMVTIYRRIASEQSARIRAGVSLPAVAAYNP